MGPDASDLQDINMKPFAVLLLPAVVAAQGSIRNNIPDFLVEGQCPKVNEQKLWQEQAPKHAKYAGRWYEVARSKNDFQLVKSCTKSDLSYDGPGFGFRHTTN